MMNLFRLCGDLLHVWSIFILLLKIYTSKSCKGISFKTQVLYMIVFLTRYIDLFTAYISLYNTIMKILFILTSGLIVHMMKYQEPYNRSYDPKIDKLPVYYIVIPCLILAVLFNEEFTFTEIAWSFSLFLESVAIVPQIIVVHNYASENEGFVENLTSDYVFCLGGYRAMYLLNWIYRYLTEPHYRNWIVWITGMIQTAVYCDFFYYYIISRMKGKNVVLPV